MLLCGSGFGHMVIQIRFSYADGSWLLGILSELGRESGEAVRFSRQDTEPEGAADPGWQTCYFSKRLLGERRRLACHVKVPIRLVSERCVLSPGSFKGI